MTTKCDLDKVLEELRFQKEEIANAQKELLHYICRIEVYVAGLSDQLCRTLEALTLSRSNQESPHNVLDS